MTSYLHFTFLYLTSPPECHFENKTLHIHQWAYASRNLVYLLSPLLHPSITLSCQNCILLVKENIYDWTTTPLPWDYGSRQHAFRHWIFMLISLHKHFHTWIDLPGFVGRSKLKQKGRKNTTLSSIRGMEKPYWTVITKTDVCHSTEGHIQTIIKTSPVQYKGQCLIWYLAVTAASYFQ